MLDTFFWKQCIRKWEKLQTVSKMHFGAKCYDPFGRSGFSQPTFYSIVYFKTKTLLMNICVSPVIFWIISPITFNHIWHYKLFNQISQTALLRKTKGRNMGIKRTLFVIIQINFRVVASCFLFTNITFTF